ncbi:oxidoreductase [Pseudonocardia sp. EC080610-09]|uniref:SDR family NAD(P)-dependent oxidoreductase n=1 Tax=unclassified Pseudonocardia TaxID=2619320 RepID=UPI0006CB7054|nr:MULTISPECIES: SDR family oxidoreductase [unclassified Pseudonocardia]ALE74305.1 oxidoreductase [Pseudonocardia sp. EC080625-04]ALL77707.1 oxidoreductase [Pseudonocardia sp. EC080610-09]ALL80623.1 oxidoreductase [Pseudonocardia sp. EC080619-01]
MTDLEPTGPGRVLHRPVATVHPEFPGRVAVITGAARGMGARFTAALAARGVHVVAGDLSAEAMTATAEELAAEAAGRADGVTPGRIVAAGVDVTSADDQRALAGRAVDEFGRLDFWVNNAGIFPFAEIPDITPEQVRSTLSVNVEGVLFGAQAAAERMGPGGAIVNMSSVSALRVRRGRGSYCTSKAAVAHLTESLAVELGDRGIRVNAIAPGFVDTDMTRWIQDDPPALAKALDAVPLHRIGSPEEVAGVLMFLLSDGARYVTGHSIAVDGGSRHV